MKRVIGPALIVSAVAFTGWAGSTWLSDDPPGFGTERDQVLKAGRQQIAALNTMDAARIDEGLKSWLDASTGPLHDLLAKDSPASKQKLQQARTTAVATVTEAAVTQLDQRAGSAQVIASVRVQLTPQAGSPTVERRRYEAGLVRTQDGWKLKSLTVIPVNSR